MYSKNCESIPPASWHPYRARLLLYSPDYQRPRFNILGRTEREATDRARRIVAGSPFITSAERKGFLSLLEAASVKRAVFAARSEAAV